MCLDAVFFGFLFEPVFMSLSFLVLRFLNNPERTMSGAAFFGLSLISGSKLVFALAVISQLSHWWFLSKVEKYDIPFLNDLLCPDEGVGFPARICKSCTVRR